MEIEQLLRYLLPQEIFEYFDLVDIREGDKQLELCLDEKPIKPLAHSEKELALYGFDEPVRIQDFPLRDRSVYFIVRRRKWRDKHTGKIYSTRWDLTSNGTSYTKEFADFLKGLFGQIPDKLQ
jgi:hypothetical protein